MSVKSIAVLVAGAGLTLACASQTPGAHPHDMSTTQHEAMARQERSEAQSHAARYDPNAERERLRCAGGAARAAADVDPCWTSTTNPTQEHLTHAEEHRKRAGDHRAASQALRDAEARACGGIRDANRDESPFDHREDIALVEPLYSQAAGKNPMKGTQGAVVTFRAVPGMTAPWLQRVIDCHLARNAALGHDVPEMAYCPLVLKDVTASVTSTQAGFAVAIKSDDTDAAREVLQRAQALVGPRAR